MDHWRWVPESHSLRTGVAGLVVQQGIRLYLLSLRQQQGEQTVAVAFWYPVVLGIVVNKWEMGNLFSYLVLHRLFINMYRLRGNSGSVWMLEANLNSTTDTGKLQYVVEVTGSPTSWSRSFDYILISSSLIIILKFYNDIMCFSALSWIFWTQSFRAFQQKVRFVVLFLHCCWPLFIIFMLHNERRLKKVTGPDQKNRISFLEAGSAHSQFHVFSCVIWLLAVAS